MVESIIAAFPVVVGILILFICSGILSSTIPQMFQMTKDKDIWSKYDWLATLVVSGLSIAIAAFAVIILL